jgi:general secretion pathway protein K
LAAAGRCSENSRCRRFFFVTFPFPVFVLRHCPSANSRQGGVALVLVLWIVVLLTIMASSFSLSIRRNTELVRNAKDQAQALALAEGGVHYAMMMLSLSDPMQRWRADGTIYEMYLVGARIRVQVYDESGKFDVNYTGHDQWHLLLERVGLETDEAQSVTDSILDWIDSDGFRRVNGAEEEEYKDAGLDYGPRNGRFRSTEELQLVLGVSAKLYAALEPLITINSKRPAIDPSKASKEVLLSLPGADEAVIEEYLAARAESAANKTLPPPVPAILAQNSGGNSGIYRMRVDARLAGGYTSGLMATLTNQTDSQAPFGIIDWQTGVAARDSLFARAGDDVAGQSY